MPLDAPVEESFPVGGGVVGDRVRAIDWTATALEPLERWPRALRTTLQIMLDSRFAKWLAWGPELTSFRGDAYLPTLVTKQRTLGSPAQLQHGQAHPLGLLVTGIDPCRPLGEDGRGVLQLLAWASEVRRAQVG